MIIEKNKDEVGSWFVSWTSPEGYIVVCKSDKENIMKAKLLAIDQMFEKLKWIEVGNWNKNAKV